MPHVGFETSLEVAEVQKCASYKIEQGISGGNI